MEKKKSNGSSYSSLTLQHSAEQKKSHLEVCSPQETEFSFFLFKSDLNTSLLCALLFKVQFPFHWTGSTSLYILHKDNSQGTTVRKHCGMWGRGRQAGMWRQGWRGKFKENKFPTTGRAKDRGNYCFSLTRCVRNMDPVAVGGLPRFLRLLQKTVNSGTRQNVSQLLHWLQWTAISESLPVLSTMIRTCSAPLELFSDAYLIHISPLSWGVFLLLLLSELAFKVLYP